MITSIVLIVVLFTCVVAAKVNWGYDYECLLATIPLSLLLIVHTVLFLGQGIAYRDFLEDRYIAEKVGEPLKSDWDARLYEYQRANSTPFFGQYVDDRFENLKPL